MPQPDAPKKWSQRALSLFLLWGGTCGSRHWQHVLARGSSLLKVKPATPASTLSCPFSACLVLYHQSMACSILNAPVNIRSEQKLQAAGNAWIDSVVILWECLIITSEVGTGSDLLLNLLHLAHLGAAFFLSDFWVFSPPALLCELIASVLPFCFCEGAYTKRRWVSINGVGNKWQACWRGVWGTCIRLLWRNLPLVTLSPSARV